MKIQILSDLHLEHDSAMPDPGVFDCGADILIIAGDIGPAPSLPELVQHIGSRAREVVFVTGNHEYYGLDTSISETDEFLARYPYPSNVHFLNGSSIILGAPGPRVIIAGATLWTDYGLDGTPEYSRRAARRGMSDFGFIKNVEPHDIARLSRQSFSVLKAVLEQAPADMPRIGVSHHLPTRFSVDRRFEGSPLNPAFASDYDDLLGHADIWVHGHTHRSLDYIHPSGCRVICNPKGYGNENTAFNPRKTVEVGTALAFDIWERQP